MSAPNPNPTMRTGGPAQRVQQRRGVLALLLHRRGRVGLGRTRAAVAAAIVGDHPPCEP